jgi:23S rRNA (adenine2503-C2)-methyltransferase
MAINCMTRRSSDARLERPGRLVEADWEDFKLVLRLIRVSHFGCDLKRRHATSIVTLMDNERKLTESDTPAAKPHAMDPTTDFSTWMKSHGQGAYRAGQIQRWLYHRRASEFQDMTDLPAGLRTELESDFSFWTTTVSKHQKSDDGTEKLLLQLHCGGQVECVLLREAERRTICVSSQVGCAMGCVFCASGLDGVDRNLTAGEILEQMLRLQRLLPEDERLSHIVMMGMGEPLANLDNVLSALDVASDPKGLGISPRRITISTVGLPPAMDRLTATNPRYHLAVSLHAPNDTLRDQLVPVNSKTGLAKIVEAADYYFETSGRRLTFEYVLLAGINDQTEHADELAQLLKGRPALLNVIPYNPVAGLPYQTPSALAVRKFREVLERNNITVKFRQRKGDKINAACGQLRRSFDQGTPPVVAIQMPG